MAAMDEELNLQMNNGNFEVVHHSKIPESTKILPMVWQMKRKRDIITNTVSKHKARLTIDSSKMKRGIHFDKTYAPVAVQSSVRLLFTLAIAFNWHTVQLDYVQAFPQAPAEKPIYLKIPVGFKMSKGTPNDYALKVIHNIYG